MDKSKHPLSRSYAAMISRCYNPNVSSYKWYGARGISVCDAWRIDFYCFAADMGDKPSPKHQIDRIDNDGDYAPGNCRWVLPVVNQRNRRSNLMLTHDGRTLPCSAWAEIVGIDRHTLRRRVAVYGLSHAEALTRPVGEHLHHADVRGDQIEFGGQSHNLRAWAKLIGISRPGLSARIKRWGVARALTTPVRTGKGRYVMYAK